VFGRVRIYPDYVVQPVTRFDAADPTKMRVQMLLCLGVGELIYTNGDIRVGSTPASTLPGFSSTITRQARTFPAMSAVKTGSTVRRSEGHHPAPGWIWPRRRRTPTILSQTA
jgi:hypothetical protein